ncbi:MAG: histidine phosphatase family protein [Erysipelotrichaceae bacterium]|nr:histidine phosphatase family protein [Erysipelotrichaceae bacterium]
MKKTLYLMRHGQTLFNLQKKIQGWCDAPLTELGIGQAQVARDYFKNNNITFDHAYSSTSERASDTLEIVTDFKMPYERLKGIKEWNFGKFEGKDEILNPKLPYGDFFAQFGGEREVEFKERVVNTLIDVMEKEENNVVLAVSHGGACAQFIRHWVDYNVVQFKPGIKNCAIFKYEYEDKKFSCIEIINHNFDHLIK